MTNDLIIDVGMHTGEDTAYYLAKGFNVVAVEPNPVLVEAARREFAGAIEAGRLRIFDVAISETTGTTQLAVSDEMSIWSSMAPEFIERNEQIGIRYRYVEVRTMRFEDVLREVGIPRYLKIDIEGLDMLCVRALRQFEQRPPFVSLESKLTSLATSFEDVFDELATLWSLGYRSFQYVNQRNHPQTRPPSPAREGRYVNHQFTIDSSGLFGEELPDEWRPIGPSLLRAESIRWYHNLAGFGGRWSRTPPSRVFRKLRSSVLRRDSPWYDLHARMPT